MKRFISIIAAAVLCAASVSARTSDTLRVLAIGNSFSVDAVTENFGDLCTAAGKHVVAATLYIGGCSLERHCQCMDGNLPDYVYYKRIDDGVLQSTKDFTLEAGICDEPWDIVTFQQSSPLCYSTETFEPYLSRLMEYVKANTPEGVRLMWHQTWAYENNTAHNGQENYGTHQDMYRLITASSREICEKHGLEVIPAGTAIENLRTSYDRDNCCRDGYHLSYTVGRYTAACAWFEAIFGESVIGNAYRQNNVPSYRYDVARNAAHLAIEKPFELTNMSEIGWKAPAANYDPGKIPEYTLPDPLVMNDGRKVKRASQWPERRAELLGMFETEMFGKVPENPGPVTFEVLKTWDDAFGGKARGKEVRIHFNTRKNAYMDLLVYTPKTVRKSPMFLGVNFYGNHTVCDDPNVTETDFTCPKHGVRETVGRGGDSDAWVIETVIDAGFGVATFYRGDVEPDFDNSRFLGAFKYLEGKNNRYPADDAWGNIAAWAWGLSRALDYLETDRDVNASRVAVIGHSRLGKTAIWAGAKDRRFAMVISNDSGCCGAAISRRRVGETVEAINMHFPHWFCNNFKKYNGKEDQLPFDQHELLALIAPRPLYVASSMDDKWADPVGEKMGLDEARKVYRLYRKEKRTDYHIKPGRHSITPVDWAEYIRFAKKYL